MGGESVIKVEVFEIVTLVSRGKPLTAEPTNVFIAINNPEADDTRDRGTREKALESFLMTKDVREMMAGITLDVSYLVLECSWATERTPGKP